MTRYGEGRRYRLFEVHVKDMRWGARGARPLLHMRVAFLRSHDYVMEASQMEGNLAPEYHRYAMVGLRHASYLLSHVRRAHDLYVHRVRGHEQINLFSQEPSQPSDAALALAQPWRGQARRGAPTHRLGTCRTLYLSDGIPLFLSGFAADFRRRYPLLTGQLRT